MKNILALIVLLAAAQQAHAQARLFSNGEAVQLDPGQAYVLVRTRDMPGGGLRGTTSFSPIFYRALGDTELADVKTLADKDPEHWKDRAQPNVVMLMAAKAWQRSNGENVMLAAVKPGTYILGGVSATNWASKDEGVMVASLCMGTVRFEARPGIVTDLGTVLLALDNQPTDIPELKNLVSGKENGLSFTNLIAIRPAPASTPPPAALAALQPAPADYRAMPAFPNYPAAALSRLAPLAGVLDYDRNGDVVDVKAGARP